jgi:hypothetical protein
MLFTKLTLATILASPVLAAANPATFGTGEALHPLIARQSSSSNAQTCASDIKSGCLYGNPTETTCRNAVCGSACSSLSSDVLTCCNQNSDTAGLENCFRAAYNSIIATAATARATALPTSTTSRGGVEKLTAAAPLGVAGSAFAWALSLLLL